MNNQMITNNPSYVRVGNYGGYLAEFYITYIENRLRGYDEDSGVFSVGFSRTLNIRPGTQVVNLRVEIWIFGGLRVMYDGSLDVTTPRCFELHNTIFNATMDEVSCNGLGSFNNSNCCRCCNCHMNNYNMY